MIGKLARWIQTYTAYVSAVVTGGVNLAVYFGWLDLSADQLAVLNGYLVLVLSGWITGSVTPNTRPALMQLRAKGIDVRSNGVELHAE